MKSTADIEVYSPDDKLQLVVEVKGKRGASEQWASALHRNLLSHSTIPSTNYFILVLPDWLYLWKDKVGETKPIEATPPTFKARTRDVLGRYLSSGNPEELNESAVVILLLSWLSDITRSKLDKKAAGKTLEWLFDSGLYDSIREGKVESA